MTANIEVVIEVDQLRRNYKTRKSTPQQPSRVHYPWARVPSMTRADEYRPATRAGP